MRFSSNLMASVAFLAATAASAQINGAAYLVRDINITEDRSAGSAPSHFIQFGDRVLFYATDLGHGRELWSTDGTQEGTSLIADLWPGRQSSLRSTAPVRVEHGVVFDAAIGSRHALYRSDGTTEGTTHLLDLRAENLTAAGNRAFFTTIYSLWTTDGTVGGTREVISFLDPIFGARTIGSPFVGPPIFIAVGDNLIFTPPVDDQTHGAELWFSDGTAAGTRFLRPPDR